MMATRRPEGRVFGGARTAGCDCLPQPCDLAVLQRTSAQLWLKASPPNLPVWVMWFCFIFLPHPACGVCQDHLNKSLSQPGRIPSVVGTAHGQQSAFDVPKLCHYLQHPQLCCNGSSWGPQWRRWHRIRSPVWISPPTKPESPACHS